MSSSQSFAGALAPIFARSLHPVSFLTGSVAGALVAATAVASHRLGAGALAAPLCVALLSILAVRIGLNAARGDGRGQLFDGSGGGTTEVLAAAGRMFALNLVWALPFGLAFGGLAPGLDAAAPSGAALLLLFVAGMVPPFALVVSLGTDSFADAVSPASWSRIFGQRTDELMTMWTVFVGGCLVAMASTAVLVLALGTASRTFSLFLGLASGAWGLGFALSLLGRLAGGFLRAGDEGGQTAAAGETTPRPRYPLDFDPTPWGSTEESGPVRVFGGASPDSAPSGGFARAQADRASSRPVAPVATAADERPPVVAHETPSHAHVEIHPDPEKLQRMMPADSVIARLRANERIEDDDVDLALEDAEHMIGQFGPHPQVLSRVATLQHRLGRQDALDSAQRAVAAARAVNNAGVLADLFVEFGAEFGIFELTESEELRMASSLVTRDRFDDAIALYDASLTRRGACLPVVKAMVQLAEDGMRSDEGAERALRLYEVIESRWPDHPFVEFVDRGRQQAQRRLERVAH